jgi:hypothetical protein
MVRLTFLVMLILLHPHSYSIYICGFNHHSCYVIIVSSTFVTTFDLQWCCLTNIDDASIINCFIECFNLLPFVLFLIYYLAMRVLECLCCALFSTLSILVRSPEYEIGCSQLQLWTLPSLSLYLRILPVMSYLLRSCPAIVCLVLLLLHHYLLLTV